LSFGLQVQLSQLDGEPWIASLSLARSSGRFLFIRVIMREAAWLSSPPAIETSSVEAVPDA
jgi:hypothetical protein